MSAAVEGLADGAWSLVLVAFSIYLVSGAVKGLLGIGLPTMAIGAMAQFVDVRLAVALAIVPMLLANAWQISRGGEPLALSRRVLRRHHALAAGMLLTLAAVAPFATRVPLAGVTLALGIVMVTFAVASLWREPPPLPERLDVPAQWIAGAVAGIFGGLAGVWAPPIIVYLGARRLQPGAFVETVGVLLFVGSVVLCAGYAWSGALDGRTALLSLALTLPAIGGYALGERLRRRVPASAFRRLVLGFFFIMGANLLRRVLSGGV